MGSIASKVFLLIRKPSEFPDRLRNRLGRILDRRSSRCRITDAHDASSYQDALAKVLGTNHLSLPSREFEDRLTEQAATLGRGPFTSQHNGTELLGRVCYAVCRMLRPTRVLETGVAYGVTSSYVLKSLSDNSHGELFSIDLPPLGRDASSFVGNLIPNELRPRWNLRIGSSRDQMPPMLSDLSPIDVFIHDSLHTYEHMKWEMENAMAGLRPGGVLIADDIEGNQAFEWAIRQPRVASWLVIKQDSKNALCGVLRLKQ